MLLGAVLLATVLTLVDTDTAAGAGDTGLSVRACKYCPCPCLEGREHPRVT